MKKNDNIFFIDPQSYYNLSIYDYSLLSRLREYNIFFFGSTLYDYLPLPANIRFIKLFRYSKYKSPWLKALSYSLSLVSLFYYCIKYRPKIFHFQWIRIFSFDYFIIRLLHIFWKTKIIFTVHDILPRKKLDKAKNEFQKLYNFCDILIAHTQTTKHELIEKFNIPSNKIVVMPHGVLDINVEKKELENTITEIKAKYNIAKKDIIVTCLGAWREYKGTDLLFDGWASSSLISSNPNLHLFIAGANNGKVISGKNIPSNIHCISRPITNAEFKAFLKLSDLSVLPYRMIDQSGLLLSIIQEHIPYCATDVGELTAPLKLGNIGWVIPEITVESVRKTLEQILNNVPNLLLIKKSSEWGKVETAYSWDKSAYILSNTYAQILKKS